MEVPKTFDELQDIVIPIVNELVVEGVIKDCTDTDEGDEFMAQDIIGRHLANKFGLDWEKLQD